MSRHSIGHCIRQARLARGISKAQLARELDITRQAVHRYELGLINIPSERLEKLGMLLGMQPGEFYAYTCPCLTIVGSSKEEKSVGTVS